MEVITVVTKTGYSIFLKIEKSGRGKLPHLISYPMLGAYNQYIGLYKRLDLLEAFVRDY